MRELYTLAVTRDDAARPAEPRAPLESDEAYRARYRAWLRAVPARTANDARVSTTPAMDAILFDD